MVEANRLADKEGKDDAEGHRAFETPDPDAEDRRILDRKAAEEEEDDAEGHQKMH